MLHVQCRAGKLFGFLIPTLLDQNAGKPDNKRRGCRSILTLLFEHAEQRAAGVSLGFAEPPLLGLVPSHPQQSAVRGQNHLFQRRWEVEFRSIFNRGTAKRFGTAIGGFSFGILTARFQNQAAHRIVVGFPRMTVDGIGGTPIRIGTTPRLLNERSDAARVGARLGDVSHRNQRSRYVGQRVDRGASHAGLVPIPHDRVEHGDRSFGIADGSVLQRDKLPDATDLLELHRTLAGRKRLQAVCERILVASKKRPCSATVVMELRELGSGRIGRRRRVGICLTLGDLGRIRFFAVEYRRDVGNGTRRSHEGRLDRGGIIRGRRALALRCRRRRYPARLFLLLTQHAP